MQVESNRGKLVVKDGWFVCPVCKRKTNQHIRPDTNAQNLELWCRTCKTIHLVNIERGQCFAVSQCR